MNSFFFLCLVFCLLAVSLDAKKKNSNLREQNFLAKQAYVCSNPFSLYNIATGAYLQVGAVAALGSYPELLCMNKGNNIITASGSETLNIGAQAPSFNIINMDSQYHFTFEISTGMNGVYLAASGWTPSGGVTLAGSVSFDSRSQWYVQNIDTSIRHSLN